MQLLLLLGLDVLVLLHPAGIFHVCPVGRQNHKVVNHGNDRCSRTSQRHDEQVEGHVQLRGLAHPEEVLRHSADFLFLSDGHNPELTQVEAEIGPLHEGAVPADGPQVEVHVDRQGGESRHTQPGQHEQVGQHDEPGADAAAAGGDLEVAVQVLDGARGEEALHHQQDAVHEEGGRDAVDHVLEDVDHGKDVQGVSGSPRHLEVGLQDGDSPRKRLMAAATEERHARIQQDGGDQGGVGNASQAFNTALETPFLGLPLFHVLLHGHRSARSLVPGESEAQ